MKPGSQADPNATLREVLRSGAFRIGLGTYQLGEQTREVCLRAFGLGYRHVDTAALYRKERAVAEAIRDSGLPRDAFLVTSKLWLDDIRQGRVREAAVRCLDALEGRVDLLLLHGPAGDFVRAWEDLAACAEEWPDGIRFIGVSNFGVMHLQALGSLPVVNQVEVSPFGQRRALVDFCQQRGVALVAHSSLTKGRKLTHPVLRECASRHPGATEAKILLAWALAKEGGGVDAVIPRSSRIEHLQENLAAAELVDRLGPEDLEALAALEEGYATHPRAIP